MVSFFPDPLSINSSTFINLDSLRQLIFFSLSPLVLKILSSGNCILGIDLTSLFYDILIISICGIFEISKLLTLNNLQFEMSSSDNFSAWIIGSSGIFPPLDSFNLFKFVISELNISSKFYISLLAKLKYVTFFIFKWIRSISHLLALRY